LARQLGARDEWIAALRRETPERRQGVEGSLEGLDDAWVAALRFAEHVTNSGHAVDDETYANLTDSWSEGEIVEITLVAGLFAYFNRFNDALRVEITK
jgi:alkylhydroperoxidase family enzyme